MEPVKEADDTSAAPSVYSPNQLSTTATPKAEGTPIASSKNIPAAALAEAALEKVATMPVEQPEVGPDAEQQNLQTAESDESDVEEEDQDHNDEDESEMPVQTIVSSEEEKSNTKPDEATETLPDEQGKPLAVSRIKSIFSADNYKPEMWLPGHDIIIEEFLSTIESRKIFIFVSLDDQLHIQRALPSSAIPEFMYFIRDGDEKRPRITEASFENRVQFGTMTGNTLDSLLRLMQGVYLPLFLDNRAWPEKVRKDFSNQAHKFMAFLTDTTYQQKGFTVLYVPREKINNIAEAAKAKDLVQRLEALIIHWTRQIKEVINNQHAAESGESSGPMEEIQFWKSRCEDLSGISQQLKHDDIKKIIDVLTLARSSYLDQFLRLSNLIQDGSNQAQDNLRFLSILVDPCRELSSTDPDRIPKILPKLLNCIRIIWTHSTYYNTKERITSLLRKLSNEIIRRCSQRISLEEIFHGDVEKSIVVLHQSIECGDSWRQIYKRMVSHVYKYTKRNWDFDQSSIFAQIDAFVQRCRDLLEVCEGQIQFARKIAGGKKAPIPFFGGSKGPEIAKSLEDIEFTFDHYVNNLWAIRKYILDVKATQWHDDFNVFKQGIKDLEVMMQKVITSAFEDANTVEKFIELLDIFHHLAKREAIKRTVEKKTTDLYNLYLHELNAVKVEFEGRRKTPEILRFHPDFAGAGYWAKGLLRRLKQPMESLQGATFLPFSHLGEEARSQYDPLVSALEDYIFKSHHDWISSTQCTVGPKLNTPLMGRTRGNFLNVTFHKDLSRLFSEVHYWQKLKMDIPFNANELYSKKEELRCLNENVLLVVRDYNTILETLNQEEHNLFKERIRFLDRKINPGLTNLTWASKGITEYFVKDCRKYSSDVQHIVTDFSDSVNSIQKQCTLISEVLLCNIEQKKIYQLSEFEESQEAFRQIVQRKLKSAHETIQVILSNLYEVFRLDGKDIQHQWTKFIDKMDEKVCDALRVCVKRSLQEMSRAINGEGGKSKDNAAEVHPLFKVNVILDNTKVEFSPTLQKLEEEVNRIARDMISTIAIIPRLTETLGDSTSHNRASMFEMIAREEDVLKIFVGIQNGMNLNATRCATYVHNWDTYREIWEINKDAFIRRYAKLKPQMSTFDADINRYNEVANNAQKEETYTNVNFVRLDCSPLKHTIVSHCNAWQNKLTTLLNNNAATELSELNEMFMTKTRILHTPPINLDQLSELVNLLNQLQIDIPTIQARFGPIREQYQILEKYEVTVKESEKLQLEALPGSWAAFLQTVSDAEKALQEYKSKFKSELLNAVDEFAKNINTIKEDFATKGPFSSSFEVIEALSSIEDYRNQIIAMTNQERSLRKGLGVFKIDQAPSKDLEVISVELEYLNQVWLLNQEWEQSWNMIKSKSFASLHPESLEDQAQNFTKKVNRVPKEAHIWDVHSSLKVKVAIFAKMLPIVIDLKNPSFRDRHWVQITDLIGKPFEPTDNSLNLQSMIEWGLEQYAEQIANVSTSATKELSIEQGLRSIEQSWAGVELDIVPYKRGSGYFKLRSVDTISELLEENQVNISSMKSSKYYVAFEAEIDHWEKILSNTMEVIEMVLQVQKHWVYLENIFVGAEDIRKQLPRESSSFDQVNELWKSILSKMHAVRNALQATQEPGVLTTLTEMNNRLEKIQKSLDTYLETKRQAFPRFYFLSNEDLLEILGQSKDPNAIQPRLRKCFDNLTRLEITGGNGAAYKATGMYSLEGEYVAFKDSVVTEGPVESWLLEIENQMRATLKSVLVNCLATMKKVKRDKWVKEWPGQMVITSSQIAWTSDTTKALLECESGDQNAMSTLKKKLVANLRKLAELVRGPLTPLEQKKITALITIEVHARDVTEKMIKAECSQVNSFDWLSQLRFYFEKEYEDCCVVRQNNSVIMYGYEYLGNSGRLVVTNLTDRVYMTLTNALNLYRGGSPQGPAGTGKTETVKDLGKALAKYVIVQNCSDTLDYRSMGRMFSGLAQSGAWGCFDEFNRIDLEVLSVVALQISSIQQALSKKIKIFIFEGVEIRLDRSCGIFITSNPSYAGRVELPDNVKSLFRPIAMMVPDSTLIAEIMLFAAGFSNSKVFSKKIDSIYRLSALQLSKQDHYDFGLRALTSGLKAAEKKKRLDPTMPDELVLFATMRETNLPKLPQQDVPLFLAILSDLFPGVEVAPFENVGLKAAIVEEMQIQKLQPVESYISKVVQLYEIKVMRHGTMIIGQSGAGKSTAWNILQGALTRLSKIVDDKGIPKAEPVKAFTLNPKSLSVGELFGEFRPNSTEWTDGIFSNLMRAACSDEKKTDQRWLVLDGPVDTSWIESMNTLLDDNKVLTLNNGERIALSANVSLLFEVDNLSQASPATVSRCGMLYFDYKDLGWQPYIQSWILKRKDQSCSELLTNLIDRYMSKAIVFRKTWQETVPVSELGVVQTFCHLFDALATPENGLIQGDNITSTDDEQNAGESFARIVELWFLFSLIWAVGGPLCDDGRKKFDMFLRELEGQFPSKDTVYEYVVDKQNKAWAPWEEKITPNWRYAPGTPFHKIFVPTVDSLRFDYLIKAMVNAKAHVLLTGDVGCGKSLLMQNLLSNLDTSKTSLSVALHARTTPSRLQGILESRLEKRTKNIYGPVNGKQLVAFVDDINMPARDRYGSQSPLEFLRYWLEYSQTYDRQKQTVKSIADVVIVGAMAPGGGSRASISPRLQSQFSILNMGSPRESSIQKIFKTILNQKLQDFEEEIKPCGDMITGATMELFQKICGQLLPTPTRMHYVFSYKDTAKVYQGMLRANREYYDSKESMIKLWVHEMLRVFSDRLVDQQDRDWLCNIVNEKLNARFDVSLSQLFPDQRPIVFTDCGSEANSESSSLIYQEIVDLSQLRTYLETKLEDYNGASKLGSLDLVLFKDAIQHLCRILRMLRASRGHALLVGVGGSGRQTLTRLATYVAGMTWNQIKVTKTFRLQEFYDQLKQIFLSTGIEEKPSVLHITIDGTFLNREGFMEEISAFLSITDVNPAFYTSDEIADIKDRYKTSVKEVANVDGFASDDVMQKFLERVRTNLHIVASISPTDGFREALRIFPTSIQQFTIDWFSAWPDDALLEVALKKINDFNVPLGSDGLKKSVSKAFVGIHMSVTEQSKKMQIEFKRPNYVTPTSYLSFVIGYCELMAQKRTEIGESATKLRNGLGKLDDTRLNVEKISKELEVSKQQIIQFQKQCEEYLVIIVQQKREADEQAKVVTAKAEKLQSEEEEVRAIAKAAEQDLAQALPILEAATKSLELLSKKDLQEIKSYGKPPPLVEKVMEAVMVLRKSEPTWEEAKRQLGNPNFIKQLINYDKENMSDKILKRISQYCADEQFQPDIIGKVSTSAKSLCMWVRAIETYGHVYRQIAPKREKLQAANEALAKKQAVLKESMTKLQEVKDKLADLTRQYEEKLAFKEKLRSQIEETETKLNRAQQLVSGLAGEKVRWEESIQRYEESLKFLPGDCILAAASLSYTGPFNSSYRSRLVTQLWIPLLQSNEVPFSVSFNFTEFRATPMELRSWQLSGLPGDQYSAENGIIVTKSKRWPLLIDPQGQASKWIKNLAKSQNLKVVDLKQADYLRVLENAINFGVPVLLQGVTETIDPSLDPILSKAIIKKGGRMTLKLGEKEIEYNPDFRLILITKLANPHFAPEIFAKTAVVNFTVKEKGLEDQLLGFIVRKERPELEEQKDILAVDVANSKQKLKELEDEILFLLSSAQGSLLDDEKLVNALNTSKSTAEEVSVKLKITEQNEKKIDVAREAYRVCAQRAAVLYFATNDLSLVDPMYQYSLEWYIALFHKSITQSKKSDDLNERLNNLNDFHTYSLFRIVCRGLFEDHKLLFAFQITMKILAAAGKLVEEEYDFLIKGGQVMDRESQMPNPATEWISELAWDNLTSLDIIQTFAGLSSSISQSERDWKAWFMTNEPEELAFPGEWENKLNSFQKLLVVRSLRPDRVIYCIRKFVGANFGQKFIESAVLDMEEVLHDSSPSVPVIFVLSSGVDPLNSLRQLATKKNMIDRFKYVSLGQGQAAKANRMIQEGTRDGEWVFLANCNYSLSWMPELEKIIERLASEKPHKDFRLWLSSKPDDRFPISILQTGIKITNEPPNGLKSNLGRLCFEVTDEEFEVACKDANTYRRLYLSLSLFHSLIIERRKFLTLGWNTIYDFNDSDFDFCNKVIVNLLNDYPSIPWDALKYLIAEANYGGRVTDDWDRRVLRTYINDLFNEEMLSSKAYKFSSHSSYVYPDCNTIHNIRDFINQLPIFDKPEVFGQHTNANIMRQITDTNKLLDTLLLSKPQTSGGQASSVDQKVLNVIADLQKRLPDNINIESAKEIFQRDLTPTRVCILQEATRYNQLLDSIRMLLENLQHAIQGVVLMSSDLEDLYNCLNEGRVPAAWLKFYPTIKNLGAWSRDLLARVEYFNDWCKGNDKQLIMLGYFTHCSGFLSAALQTHARRNNIAVDTLCWESSVIQTDEDSSNSFSIPAEGLVVQGLILEGASWDKKVNCLKEPRPMELSVPLPPVHLKPFVGKRRTPKGFYLCPVYYYPVRAGTSERASYVMPVELKVGANDSDFWIKRGTALLCTN